MRAASMALGILLAVACEKRETPPSLPQSEAPTSAEKEEIEAPKQPTPAFIPAGQGSCAPAYRLVESTCVHRLFEAGSEAGLRTALDAYRRGAAPPMLGPVLASAPPRPQAKPRDPGSLMRRGASADAGGPKDQRLAELDAMLTLARAKLAKRDEESKAKKVADAPRAAQPAQARTDNGRAALDSFAQNVGEAPGPGPGASGDPTQARMGELSRIASQLSGEQLQALTAELGKTGFNAGALEAILSEARDEHKSH